MAEKNKRTLSDTEKKIAVVVGVVVVCKLRKDVKELKRFAQATSTWAGAVTTDLEQLSQGLTKTSAVAEKALEMAAKVKK